MNYNNIAMIHKDNLFTRIQKIYQRKNHIEFIYAVNKQYVNAVNRLTETGSKRDQELHI